MTPRGATGATLRGAPPPPKTTTPGAGSHLGRRGRGGGGRTSCAWPQMPRPSGCPRCIPLPTPGRSTASFLHRPRQTSQLLSGHRCPNPNLRATKLGAVGGPESSCREQGVVFPDNTPSGGLGGQRVVVNPTAPGELGVGDPLGDTQAWRNKTGQGDGTGCLGLARARLEQCLCLRVWFCMSPSLSFCLGRKRKAGGFLPTPLPAVWERCSRKNCS